MAISQEVLGILVQLEGKAAFIAGAREEQLAIAGITDAQKKAAAASDEQAAANIRMANAHTVAKRALNGVMLGLTGVAVESVKAAIKFYDMGKTISQQTGLTGKSLEDLMQTIMHTASRSPYAFNEIAEAAVLLRTKFHETDSQIEKTAGLMAAFAQRVGGSTKDVSTSVLTIMQDYKQPLSSVIGLTDKLTSVSQATQKPMGELLGVIEKYGPKLQAMGFGLDETIKMLGVFQASGITTNMMGRGLSAALTKAEKETEKTGESIPAIIQRHIKEVAGATSSQESLNLALKFFGAQVGPTFSKALYDNANALKSVEQAMGKTGSTQKLFAAQQKEVGGKWNEVKNQMFEFLVAMGEQLLPVLQEGMRDIVSVTKSIMELTDHGKLLMPIILGLVGAWIAYKAAMVGYAVWKTVAVGIDLVRGSMILLRAQLAALAVWEGMKAFATAVATADTAVIASNAAAAASFMAMLAPIALVAAAIYGLNKILPKGENVESLLGGNQPGESLREGESTVKKWNDLHRKTHAAVHTTLKQAEEATRRAYEHYYHHKPPGFAEGGVMPYSGWARINERGPGETVWLPGGASVQPSPASAINVVRAHVPMPTMAHTDYEPSFKLDAVLVMPNGQVLTSIVTKELEVKRSRL